MYSWNSHMCFPRRCLCWSLCLKGISSNLFLSKLAPLLWSFLVLSLLHPRLFISLHLSCFCALDMIPLLHLVSYIIYFLTLLPSVPDSELPGCRNGVIFFPVSSVPSTGSWSTNNCFWNWSSVSKIAVIVIAFMRFDGNMTFWRREDEGDRK